MTTTTSTATYTVAGMTCGHCVASVTEEVSALGGVTGVTVDLATGLLTVTGAPAAVADAALVRTAVEEAGYTMRDGVTAAPGSSDR